MTFTFDEKMKRIRMKAGDVFVAPIEGGQKYYIQFIGKDPNELNSDVIRIFKRKYGSNEDPSVKEIVDSEVLAHRHVYVTLGRKNNGWERIGNDPVTSELSETHFRSSEDYGNPKIKYSEKWWVWSPTDEAPRFIGKMEKKFESYDLGGVWPPSAITELAETEKSTWFYPEYKLNDANQSAHTTPASAPR